MTQLMTQLCQLLGHRWTARHERDTCPVICIRCGAAHPDNLPAEEEEE